MIRLERLTKTYLRDGQAKTVVRDLSLEIPSGVSVGLLGRNGAGKSSLLRLIAGTMTPTSGRVISEGSISWPVGFAGSFADRMTGAQNVRFVARIYGVDTDELVDFVADFAELGPQYHLPIAGYSSGMRARLAFGISMGIHFDTYLVDEVTSVGDEAFKRKSNALFLERMQGSGAIVVSHSMGILRQLCTIGLVLEAGEVRIFDDIEAAIAHHMENMRG